MPFFSMAVEAMETEVEKDDYDYSKIDATFKKYVNCELNRYRLL